MKRAFQVVPQTRIECLTSRWERQCPLAFILEEYQWRLLETDRLPRISYYIRLGFVCASTERDAQYDVVRLAFLAKLHKLFITRCASTSRFAIV